jgi:peroxiredoxin
MLITREHEFHPVNSMVEIGEWAPDFTVADHKGNIVRLSNLRGQRIVLSFHPLAWTSDCADHMKALEAHWQAFNSFNAVAFGISVDSVPCKRAWAQSIGIEKTSLLSDFWPHGGVAQMYDVFDSTEGVARRSNIVVDEFQHIIFMKEYEKKTVPDMQEIVEVLGVQEESRKKEEHLPKI